MEKYLEQHAEFLDKYYAEGIFIASGRKVPRTGGIILANADSRAEVGRIISEDPFWVKRIADYEIIEFEPTKTTAKFETLIA
ncbi:MAG: YciI family protein [Micrococcaceae bacterium]